MPLYSSGGRDDSTYRTFWDALYQYNADLVLSGHDHTYERFAPQNPERRRGQRAGHPPVRRRHGRREPHVVRDHDGEQPGPRRPDVRLPQADPAPHELRLAVHPEPGKTFTDSGSQSCHGVNDDVTPPSTPTGLTAAASAPNKVDLSWTASTDNRGVEGYRIRRNGSLIATITTGTSSDTTANPATSYSYTVDAYDVGLNYSPQSAPAAATTPPDTVAPTAPSNLTALTSARQVRLTWTASTDNVGVDRYRVFRDGLEIGTSPRRPTPTRPSSR